MESKTVRQLQDDCRENNIRGYSKLKKTQLIELIQNKITQNNASFNNFQFHDDLFRKPKKEREAKVKSCEQYYKQPYMKFHLKSKKHQDYEETHAFSFDNNLFSKPNKPRQPQLKCGDSGVHYKPAYKGHHLLSITHR